MAILGHARRNAQSIKGARKEIDQGSLIGASRKDNHAAAATTCATEAAIYGLLILPSVDIGLIGYTNYSVVPLRHLARFESRDSSISIRTTRAYVVPIKHCSHFPLVPSGHGRFRPNQRTIVSRTSRTPTPFHWVSNVFTGRSTASKLDARDVAPDVAPRTAKAFSVRYEH